MITSTHRFPVGLFRLSLLLGLTCALVVSTSAVAQPRPQTHQRQSLEPPTLTPQSSENPQTPQTQPSPQSPQSPQGPIYRMQAVVTNLTANATSGIIMTMQLGSDGTATISGQLDNQNLFGSFESNGNQIYCGETIYCYQANGTFHVGGADGSGFPEGTSASFTITLAIENGQVRGVYRIGLLPDFTWEQYGIIEGNLTP
jgi:hypothetical protein